MLLSKMGYLTRIKFKQTILPNSTILYRKYKGNYDLINTKVQ
jgi:hypothetical protein